LPRRGLAGGTSAPRDRAWVLEESARGPPTSAEDTERSSMRLPPEALLLAALVPLAACYEDDDHCHDCGPPVFFEIEPNDVPAQANSLGTLYPGDWLAIEGRLSEFGPDLLDGFS